MRNATVMYTKSTCQIILVLIQKWLEDANRLSVPSTPLLTRSNTYGSLNDNVELYHSDRHSYQTINSECTVYDPETQYLC